MKKILTIAIVLITMSFLLSVGCDKKEKKTANKTVLSEHYTIIDSGLWNDGRAINWMDDHRIITYGIYPDISSEGKIYIWDIDNNQITEYSDGGPPCYFDGYIYYPYKTNLNLTEDVPYGAGWKEGLIGNEKIFQRKHRIGEGRLWHRNNKRNKFDCKLSKRPKEMENRVWVPLIEEHGYLDFGQIGYGLDEVLPVLLVGPKKKNKKLEFTKNEVGLTSGIYSTFKNAYFYWPHVIDVESRKQWEKNGCLYGWWLDPDSGDSYSECIPFTSWTSSPDVIPTRQGLFMTNNNYRGAEPQDSGGYLKQKDGFLKVIKGKISKARVSPDGCTIAMAHKLTYFANKKEKLTLKVVNICK